MEPLDPRDEQERPLIWRGPFAVKRQAGVRGRWRIVNRYGETERDGYAARATAEQVCGIMNEARALCDEVQK